MHRLSQTCTANAEVTPARTPALQQLCLSSACEAHQVGRRPEAVWYAGHAALLCALCSHAPVSAAIWSCCTCTTIPASPCRVNMHNGAVGSTPAIRPAAATDATAAHHDLNSPVEAGRGLSSMSFAPIRPSPVVLVHWSRCACAPGCLACCCRLAAWCWARLHSACDSASC